MKNLLMIAYYYPPQSNGGTPRPFQFAKYLPNFNYNPVIITTNNYGYLKDESNIYRVRDYLIKGVGNNDNNLSLIKKVFRRLSYHKEYFLHKDTRWFKDIFKIIPLILEKEKIDIIWITFPPKNSLELVKKLKQITDIPIISDFRDGFVFEPLWKESKKITQKNMKIERTVVENSDYLITVSPSITQYFRNQYKINDIKTITNGYDREIIIPRKNQTREKNKKSIVYTGRLSMSYREQSIQYFVKAIKSIKITSTMSDYEFVFAGQLTSKEVTYLKRELGDRFINVGNLSHEESLKLQENADLLLLIANSKERDLSTTKLFEYISSGVPIFAITKGTHAEKIILQTQTGMSFDPDNLSEVVEGLEFFLNNGVLEKFSPIITEIEKYHRKNLTKQLAVVFDKLL